MPRRQALEEQLRRSQLRMALAKKIRDVLA
jgi:hypothetical protein